MDVRIEEVATAMLEATELPDGTARVAPDRPFADVVHEHLDRLYGYCVHLCGDLTDAEDLLQDTLVRAMRSFDGLRDPKAARTWLFTIPPTCTRCSRPCPPSSGRRSSSPRSMGSAARRRPPSSGSPSARSCRGSTAAGSSPGGAPGGARAAAARGPW